MFAIQVIFAIQVTFAINSQCQKWPRSIERDQIERGLDQSEWMCALGLMYTNNVYMQTMCTCKQCVHANNVYNSCTSWIRNMCDSFGCGIAKWRIKIWRICRTSLMHLCYSTVWLNCMTQKRDSNDTLLSPNAFSETQSTVTHCNTLQHTVTHCNTLQHTAAHCNTL